MAATMPKDLKRETWKKIKPILMKKTQLGEALEAYAKKREAVLKKQSLAQFGELTDELEKVKKAVGVALGVAKAGKHKDCEESLKGYTSVIAKEAQELMVLQSKYKKDVDDWTKLRVDCLAGMAKHKTSMEQLATKIGKTVQSFKSLLTGKTLAKPVVQKAVTLAGKDLETLDALRKNYVATCKSVREAPATNVHADDRDPQYLIALNQVQSLLEGEYSSHKGELEKAMKDLEAVAV